MCTVGTHCAGIVGSPTWGVAKGVKVRSVLFKGSVRREARVERRVYIFRARMLAERGKRVFLRTSLLLNAKANIFS